MSATPTSNYVNWLVLGELGVVVIVACAFLLYFNRLFGSVFAFFIRLYTWRKHHAYITIGSLQFAPLAGRIAFRNVEYHSSNISVRMLHGYITFRYWAWRVRQEGDSQSSNAKRFKLPCRLVLFADGVEFFVYNRTPAYDAIVERMKKHERENDPLPSDPSRTSTENPIKVRLRKAFKSAHEEDVLAQLDSTVSSNEPDEKPTTVLEPLPTPDPPQADGVDWFRELLPIEFVIEKGSLVLGSDATPMVLIGDFKRATGIMEITEARSICDRYKMSVAMKFEEVKVLYRTNVEWSGPLLAHGKKVYDELVRQDPDFTKQPPSSFSTKSAFIALARKFPFLTDPAFSKPPRQGMPRDKTWRGLARYREESTKEAPKYEREYAKVTTLIDTAAMDLTYYSDTPGPVPNPGEIDMPDPTDAYGNVDLPPEYGMDIVIHGGLVQYGPWADRQREALQKTFAPNIFFDTEPRPPLRAGETRVHADLVVTVQFSEETNLRIPTREPSKDWQFDAKPEAELERRYGWLDVTTGVDSTITYTQSQLATARGYDATLLIHLDSLSIASSINLQSFVEAKSCRLALSMPTPLRWNAQRDWGLDMSFDTPNITLLRDHVTLISDLAKDWSSGVAGDFHHFVPVHYNFKISMTDYAFHLYINDSNIVDRPQARDDNAFVDILGPNLSAYVAVASTQYRPEFSVVPFNVSLDDARLELSLPKWDTHRSFHSQEPIEIGRIGKGSASGSYRYYSNPHPEHEETLTLHLDASKVAFKCLGWALRRLFCVKDNYFGMFTQFTTTQEYLERFDHDPNSVGDPVEEKYRPGRSDPFAVQVTLDVRDSLLLLSDEIYACESGLALPIPQFQMLLKSVEGFMELSLDMPPTYIVAAPTIQDVYDKCQPPPPSSSESIYLEGLVVKANRLFGPQPRGTTYLCLWEISIPKLSAFLSPAFLSSIRSSITAVAYNFSDKENAPTNIYIPVTPPDVTFFKLSVGSASILMGTGTSGVAVDLTSGIKFDTSSLATLTSASSLAILIPRASVTLLSRPSTLQKWCSVGSLHSGVSVDIYKAPKEWQEQAQKQQKFLMEEDQPTQRIWYMYSDREDTSKSHHLGSSYLPRPHAVGHESEDDDSDGEGSESDSDRRSRPAMDRRRSTTRSFRTAKETLHDSLSDESDDCSSVASSNSSHEPPDSATTPDMASILADHIRDFKAFRQTPGQHQTEESVFSEDLKCPATPLANGTVIRISVEPVNVEASVQSLTALTGISSAFDANHARPRQVLDKLLDEQVDEFADRNNRPVPRILDITAPSIRVHISTESPDSDPVSRLSLAIGGLCARLSQEPAEPSNPPNLSASVSLTSLRALVLSTATKAPKISLSDISLGSSQASGSPVLQLDKLGLTAAYVDKANDKQIRVHTHSTDLRMVSSALSTAMQTADIWQKQLDAKKTSESPSPTLASLLSSLITAINPNIENAPQPAFVSELTYELQVDDDRNIRRDHGWRVLSRLRQILLHTSIDEAMLHLDHSAVINAISRLDWVYDDSNEELTRQLTFVRKAFDLPPPSPSAKSLASQAAFVSIENVVIRHYDYLLGTGRIGSSFVRAGTSSAGVYRTRPGKGDGELQDRAVIAVSSVDAEIQDSIFTVFRQLTSEHPHSPAEAQPIPTPKVDAVILVNVHLGSADFSVIAGGLKLRTVLTNTTSTIGHLQRQHKRHGLSSFVTVRNDINLVLDKAEIVLWQPSDDENPANSADREVILIGITGVKIVTDTQGSTRASSVKEQRVILALQSVTFDSRPTLRRALDFAQVWQEKHYPHYEPTINQLRSRVANNPARVPKPNKIPTNLTFDFLVEKAALTVRTAKSAWIGWRVGRIYACEQGSIKNHSFGIRAAPQSIGFYSSRDLVKTKDTVKIDLPRVKVDGVLRTVRNQGQYEVELNLGYFDCIVKPSALDKLLSLYKTLVPEIRQLVKDYGSYAQSMFSSPAAPADSPNQKKSPLFRLQLGVEGVSIGLRADDVATTLLLRALALKGRATNRDVAGQALSWQAGVQHFEVSLGQIDDESLERQTDVSRKYKSAYMYLDVDVYEVPSDKGAPSRLGVSLSRIQTFMHIVALSEVSDLISSWTSDLHILTDQRGSEVAEVRQTTSRLLKKIEAGDRLVQPEDSWFASRLLTIDIASFGLAVPLGAGTVIDIRKQINSVTPALLFSVRSISFVNRRNETARFRVQHIGLQFVSKFDASLSEHFMGEFHSSVNRMALPLIDAEAQMSSQAEAWTLAAHCSATDFNLGLDPDFIEGIFQLIDLYERGRDRVDELEKRYRAEVARNEAAPYRKDTLDSPVSTRVNQRIFLRLSFTFESGKVRLYRAAGDGHGGIRGGWHDEVVLPGISVWVDYAGPSMDGLADKKDTAGLVILNAAVHQSRNVLRPSILPFFVQVANRVEKRFTAKRREDKPLPSPQSDDAAPIEEAVPSPDSASINRLRLTLRIDSSELRLACNPDSQAYVNLRWESGGFVGSTTFGKEENSTFAGTISGVSTNLSHEYDQLGRSCIEASARDLAFSVIHTPDWKDGQAGISIVIDTRVSAQFRLDLFSAWLTFISVWVDNAGLDAPIIAAIGDQSVAPVNIPAIGSETRKHVGVAIIARFQAIDFDADVTVSHAKLKISPVILHTLSNGLRTRIDLEVGKIEVTAQGDISGAITVDDFAFHTLRKSTRATEDIDPQLLSLALHTGHVRCSFFLRDSNVARIHLEPSTVFLSDDWTDPSAPPLLAFAVQAGQLSLVVRLLAIPRLLGKVYEILDAVGTQHRIASQRSETFKAHKARKVHEPSPISTALAQTMQRTASHQSQTLATCDTVFSQTMKFALAGIDIGVFNESQDGKSIDFYRFVVGAVGADLLRMPRKVDGEDRPFRDLALSVGFFQWDAMRNGRQAVALESKEISAEEMLALAAKLVKDKVAALPSMDLRMDSDEYEGTPPKLLYHFTLVWGKTKSEGDVSIFPSVFDNSWKALKLVIAGIEQEEAARARRLGVIRPSKVAEQARRDKEKEKEKEKEKKGKGEKEKEKEKKESNSMFSDTAIRFEPRDPSIELEPPVPKLSLLGAQTRDAAKLIPRFNQGVLDLPILSHRFVTTSLEEGMDLLLKLYAKQLPAKKG